MKTIDCKKTENYLSERKRMCKRTKCSECPLGPNLNGTNKFCSDFEHHYASKAVEIVQKWSNKHPQRTLLSEFLEHYPNVKLNSCGYPEYIIPCGLGAIYKDCAYRYNSSCCGCQDCWDTPVEESEE